MENFEKRQSKDIQEKMIRVCGWCDIDLDDLTQKHPKEEQEKLKKEGKKITHGICDECAYSVEKGSN